MVQFLPEAKDFGVSLNQIYENRHFNQHGAGNLRAVQKTQKDGPSYYFGSLVYIIHINIHSVII